jgi:hypothetical protein
MAVSSDVYSLKPVDIPESSYATQYTPDFLPDLVHGQTYDEYKAGRTGTGYGGVIYNYAYGASYDADKGYFLSNDGYAFNYSGGNFNLIDPASGTLFASLPSWQQASVNNPTYSQSSPVHSNTHTKKKNNYSYYYGTNINAIKDIYDSHSKAYTLETARITQAKNDEAARQYSVALRQAQEARGRMSYLTEGEGAGSYKGLAPDGGDSDLTSLAESQDEQRRAGQKKKTYLGDEWMYSAG